MNTREALQEALIRKPDDLVLHSVYADYLIEQNDPRGEYIRLQLQAEDRNQAADRLCHLEQSAFDIRLQHEREWLGELWPFIQRPPGAVSVAEPMEPNLAINWRRGWIDSIQVGTLTHELSVAIANHPLTHLLRIFSAEVHQGAEDRLTSYRANNFRAFRASGRFHCLRELHLGSLESGNPQNGWTGSGLQQVVPDETLRYIEVIEMYGEQIRVPNLSGVLFEQLRRLSIIRVVEVAPDDNFAPDEHNYAWVSIPKNLPRLQYLTLRLPEFHDAGVAELLASGMIQQLKGLDLSRCNITDDGARQLAAHPHVRNLEFLRLGGNLFSPIGIEALQEFGFDDLGSQLFDGRN
jgi:uncharacterized protein (TIGR02996 family)